MQEHEKWLKIVHEDLTAAKALIKIELFSTVTYHCQQAAEKSLKAYLVFKKHPVIKTHDLVQLLELCMKFSNDFKMIYEPTKLLNPFSSKSRYPTEYDIPDLADSKLAIKHMQSIVNFVLKKIAAPEMGQTNIFNKLGDLDENIGKDSNS